MGFPLADPPRSRIPSPRQTVEVLGLPVDAVDANAAHAWIAQALADPWDGRCRQLVTLNPEYVMAARNDPEFAGAIRTADLIVADGVGVVIAARWLSGTNGRKVGRTTGVDLTGWLTELSESATAPLFLLGGAAGVASKAAAALQQRWPQARIAGEWSGGTPRPDDDRPTLERIAASGARVVLVAYSFPGQVTWITRNQAALATAGVRLAIGVGGTFDFYAGRVPRAPALLRRLGLEWLYRLGREPWRWRRQLVLPHFAWLTLLATIRRLPLLSGRNVDAKR